MYHYSLHPKQWRRVHTSHLMAIIRWSPTVWLWHDHVTWYHHFITPTMNCATRDDDNIERHRHVETNLPITDILTVYRPSLEQYLLNSCNASKCGVVWTRVTRSIIRSFSIMVADDLAPMWCQDICNHPGDQGKSRECPQCNDWINRVKFSQPGHVYQIELTLYITQLNITQPCSGLFY